MSDDTIYAKKSELYCLGFCLGAIQLKFIPSEENFYGFLSLVVVGACLFSWWKAKKHEKSTVQDSAESSRRLPGNQVRPGDPILKPAGRVPDRPGGESQNDGE